MNVARAIFILALGGLTATCSSAEAPLPTTPVVDYITSAFMKHAVVALSERHGCVETFTLFTSIVRDPAFHAAGADVVVEFGNARFQDVADRYVAGEAVAREDLERIWLDTTQPNGKALVFVGGAHIARRVIFPNSLIHLLDLKPAPQALVVSVVDIDAVAPALAPTCASGPSGRRSRSRTHGWVRPT